MEEAKRKGLEKLKESLILAAEDMDQAFAAAVALRTDTSDDETWRRALETAIAVSYMRPFTSGAWKLPGKYVPKGQAENELHRRLDDLRDKVYAHSDESSGRSASMKTVVTSGGISTISYGSAWWAFPVEDLPAVQALCHDQRQRFLADASTIHVELEEADAGV
jgi:urocanate hydratase